MIKFILQANYNINLNIIKLDLVQTVRNNKDVWVINYAAYTRPVDPNIYGWPKSPYVDIFYEFSSELRNPSGAGLPLDQVYDTKDQAILASEAYMKELVYQRILKLRKEIESLDGQIETWKLHVPKRYMKNRLLK